MRVGPTPEQVSYLAKLGAPAPSPPSANPVSPAPAGGTPSPPSHGGGCVTLMLLLTTCALLASLVLAIRS